MTFHIETDRLLMREFRFEDANEFFRMDSLPEVHRYLGNEPVASIQQTMDNIDKIRQQYNKNGIGRWAAFEKTTGNFIGWTGLKYVTESQSERVNYYDVGYRLHPDFWGKGYATESALAALEYGFNKMNLAEIVGTCHEGNLASRRVLEKCGLELVDQFMWGDIRCNWLKIGKEKWTRQFIPHHS